MVVLHCWLGVQFIKIIASKAYGSYCKWMGSSPKCHVSMKSSGLSCNDAGNKDDWRLRIMGWGIWLT